MGKRSKSTIREFRNFVQTATRMVTSRHHEKFQKTWLSYVEDFIDTHHWNPILLEWPVIDIEKENIRKTRSNDKDGKQQAQEQDQSVIDSFAEAKIDDENQTPTIKTLTRARLPKTGQTLKTKDGRKTKNTLKVYSWNTCLGVFHKIEYIKLQLLNLQPDVLAFKSRQL